MSISLSTLSGLLLDLSEREDRRRERQRRNNLRKKKSCAFEMTDTEFVKTFRLTKDLVLRLIEDLAPLIPRERRSDVLSINDKILIALAFYATGSYQTIVGQSNFNSVSQPTVSRAVRQVTKALNDVELFKKHIYFPLTLDGRDRIKRSFYEKTKMPGVVGCIDGTHIAIVRPINHEERFFNRKGYHSLNVMIVCDSDLNILCIDPSNPGSTHDSTVWRHNRLNQYVNLRYNAGETMYFLGDSGYPLRKTMMTPFLNAEAGSPEAYYYNVQVSARNIVERCIGVLKSRFRCLLVARKLHYDPVTAGGIINACAILHNIANRARLTVPNLSQEENHVEQESQPAYNYIGGVFPELQSRSRVNMDLQHGRMAQQALIQRLWSERNYRLS